MSYAHLPVRHVLQQLEEGRSDRSRRFQLPAWLESFIENAAEHFEPETDSARAGYVCSCTDDGWQVTLFLGMTEVVGGADDGAQLLTGFQFNLEAVRGCFDQIDRVCWLGFPSGCQSNPTDVDESYLVIDGMLNGQRLRLLVALRSPKGIGPGLLKDADGRYSPAP